jgi:predicted DNA-binding transcriptional regulator AlpA
MGRRQRQSQSHAQSVWRQVLELSDHEQLDLYQLLSEHLALGPGHVADTEVEDRVQSMKDMAAAAEYLQLPAGTAPTYPQYEKAHKALGLSLSAQQVQRRWNRWRTATNAFEGGRSAPTAAQRSFARATLGRDRQYEDYLAGLRKWLDSEPRSLTDVDYNEFVEEHNRTLVAGDAPFVRAQSVVLGLDIGWEAAVAVAYDEVDLETARQQTQHRREAQEGTRGLIGRVAVAQLLDFGRNEVARRSRQPDFPVRVALISRRPAWVRSDIEAYAAGEAVPHRQLDEAQAELIDSREMAQLLGLSGDSLRTRIHEQRWDRVPEPSGQVSDAHYWERSEYEAWSAGRRRVNN